MQNLTRLSVVAAVVLAGCASIPHSAGKFLVYRDNAGNVLRQFVYPDEGFCRRVAAVAGSAARCQPESVPGLQAEATLRYNPPGILVHGQYADLARCQADTSKMSAGVEVINPCSAK